MILEVMSGGSERYWLAVGECTGAYEIGHHLPVKGLENGSKNTGLWNSKDGHVVTVC